MDYSRHRIRKGERSILDFSVVENGSINSKETEVHVCVAGA